MQQYICDVLIVIIHGKVDKKIKLVKNKSKKIYENLLIIFRFFGLLLF